MGQMPDLQAADRHFRSSGYHLAPMGSSGMKRKGRKHQPKVGTKPERDYALHQSEHAVMANMGVSKGWMFWTAIVVVVVLVFFAILGMALWF